MEWRITHPNSYIIYFDNFFTSTGLLPQPADKQFRQPGSKKEQNQENMLAESKRYEKFTLRSHRLCIRENVRGSRALQGSTRHHGSWYKSLFSQWKAKGKKSLWKRRNIIVNYNAHMGRDTRHNWLASNYGISVRGKELCRPLFTRFVDMALVNA